MMTVKELIEILSQLDPDLIVYLDETGYFDAITSVELKDIYGETAVLISPWSMDVS